MAFRKGNARATSGRQRAARRKTAKLAFDRASGDPDYASGHPYVRNRGLTMNLGQGA